MRRRLAAIPLVLALAGGLPAVAPNRAWAESDATDPETLDREARSRRIVELERGIRRAHERLADLLSEPAEARDRPLRERGELAEIAAELGTLRVELRALRAALDAQRARPEGE